MIGGGRGLYEVGREADVSLLVELQVPWAFGIASRLEGSDATGECTDEAPKEEKAESPSKVGWEPIA